MFQIASPKKRKYEYIFYDTTVENATGSSNAIEILKYLNKPSTNSVKDLSQLDEFPIVKRLFAKYNSILPSSASVERLFSLGGVFLCFK